MDERGRVGHWGGWGSGEDRKKVRSRGMLELTSTSWALVIEIRSGRFGDEVALFYRESGVFGSNIKVAPPL